MMRAIWIIFYREFLNCIRDKVRVISSAAMTIILLLVFSVALGNFDTTSLGISKIQYLLPGIIAATISMTAISNSLSVVTDKSEGFMREFLVSPTSRTNIAIGKILGTSITAVIQGTLILIVSPFFGMRYTVLMLLQLYVAMITISLVCSSIGLFIASRIKSQVGFQMMVQAVMLPMVFLSGAYIPIKLLPSWLGWFVHINPITYAVSAFRHITLSSNDISAKVLNDMGLILYIGDYKVIPIVSIGIMLIIGLVFLGLAVMAFRRMSATHKVTLRKGFR